MKILDITLLHKSGTFDSTNLDLIFTHVTCCNGNNTPFEIELDLDFSTHDQKLEFEDNMNKLGCSLVTDHAGVPFGSHFLVKTTSIQDTEFYHLVNKTTGKYYVLPVKAKGLDHTISGKLFHVNNILNYLSPTDSISTEDLHLRYRKAGGQYTEGWVLKSLITLQHCQLVEKTTSGWSLA